MCLPSVNWSSVALATPNANNKKVQTAVLIMSRRFQFSANTLVRNVQRGRNPFEPK